MRAAAHVAAALGAAALVVGGASGSPGGALDTSFGDGGRASVDFGAGELLFRADVLPDGHIVAAGSIGGGSGMVVRVTPAGRLDPTFDADGRAVVASIGWRTALAVQRDGKVLVAGMSAVLGESGMRMTRLDADGSVDTSFGTGGFVRVSVGTFCAPYHVLIAADGKILVVGQTDAGRSGNSDILVLRYGADGAVDTTFGSGGHTVADWGRFDVPFGAAIAPDGRIVVGGFSEDPTGANPVAVVGRFTSDGRPDTSFGSGGFVATTHDAFNMAGGVAVQPDGKILLAAGNPFAVLRLTQSGSPDSSFGKGGWATTGTPGEVSRAVAVQTNGKVVVVGRKSNESGHAVFVVERLLPNGALDGTFNGGTPAVAGQAFPEFVSVAADGRIVAGGWAYGEGAAPPSTAMLFRYLPGTCSVPRLVGSTLGAAKTKLASADCRLGSVKNATSKRVPKGRIVAQAPSAGREAPDWAVVGVTLSRGPR